MKRKGSKMPAVARVGIDRSGNIIIGALAPTVFVNGAPIAVQSAPIASYGDDCKSAPLTGAGSGVVLAEGKQVVRAGDLDICGTPITSGSNVNAG